MPALPKTVIKIGQVAKLLNIPITTVRRWADEGRLPTASVSRKGHRYFDRDEVVDLGNRGMLKPRSYLSHAD